MKISNFVPLFILLAALGLHSCSPSLTPFTQKLYDQNNWSEEELKRIQFYLSEDIVLRKQVSSGDSKIESGDIKIVSGSKVEEIIIKRGTPGVLAFMPKKKRFAISFEEGDEGRYLMFGPNPKRGNRYLLLASDWKRRKGEVSYGDQKYYTTSDSAYAALLVNLKKVRNVQVKSRKAKGRTVD